MTSIFTSSPSLISEGLVDNYGRKITYLRLAITDRCNLRCKYCMPEEGIKPLNHDRILSFEEMERLVRMLSRLGVRKVRITGGEPFVRKGCVSFLEKLKKDCKVPEVYVTTNGVDLFRHLPDLKRIGISGINLSLDTLNKEKYRDITRRDQMEQVLAAFYEILRLDIRVKINSVILAESKDEDIVELASLVSDNPVSLRFIEQMPFSGKKQCGQKKRNTLEHRLKTLFPGLKEISSNTVETARRFEVPGAKGTLGIIEGESRSFCSSCNKVRITPQGTLKTCLYDDGSLELLPLLRGGMSDEEITTSIVVAVKNRFANGHLAEKANRHCGEDSMATIGG